MKVLSRLRSAIGAAELHTYGGTALLAVGAGTVWSPGAGAMIAGAILLALGVAAAWEQRRSRTEEGS